LFKLLLPGNLLGFIEEKVHHGRFYATDYYLLQNIFKKKIHFYCLFESFNLYLQYSILIPKKCGNNKALLQANNFN